MKIKTIYLVVFTIERGSKNISACGAISIASENMPNPKRKKVSDKSDRKTRSVAQNDSNRHVVDMENVNSNSTQVTESGRARSCHSVKRSQNRLDGEIKRSRLRSVTPPAAENSENENTIQTVDPPAPAVQVERAVHTARFEEENNVVDMEVTGNDFDSDGEIADSDEETGNAETKDEESVDEDITFNTSQESRARSQSRSRSGDETQGIDENSPQITTTE